MDIDEKFTVNQVAFIVKRTPKTIYRWIGEGFLRNVVKVRDGYLIPKKELDRIQKDLDSTVS